MFALPVVTFTAAALMGLLLSTCSASSTPIGSAFLKKTAAHLRKLQGKNRGYYYYYDSGYYYYDNSGNDNSCAYANDGECDGPDYCGDGTDCSDCGTCSSRDSDYYYYDSGYYYYDFNSGNSGCETYSEIACMRGEVGLHWDCTSSSCSSDTCEWMTKAEAAAAGIIDLECSPHPDGSVRYFCQAGEVMYSTHAGGSCRGAAADSGNFADLMEAMGPPPCYCDDGDAMDDDDDDDDDLESAAVSLKTGSFLVTTMLGAIILVSSSK